MYVRLTYIHRKFTQTSVYIQMQHCINMYIMWLKLMYNVLISKNREFLHRFCRGTSSFEDGHMKPSGVLWLHAI